MEKDAIWCLVSIEEEETIEAKIIHVGRGKFKILDDVKGGKYAEKKIDASDIFYCRLER
jgi:hypothetical protein